MLLTLLEVRGYGCLSLEAVQSTDKDTDFKLDERPRVYRPVTPGVVVLLVLVVP